MFGDVLPRYREAASYPQGYWLGNPRDAFVVAGGGKRSHAGLRRAPCRTAPRGRWPSGRAVGPRSASRRTPRICRRLGVTSGAVTQRSPRPPRAPDGLSSAPLSPTGARASPVLGGVPPREGAEDSAPPGPAAPRPLLGILRILRMLEYFGYADTQRGGGGSNFPGGAVSRARPSVRCAGRAGQLPESPSTDRDGRSERRLPVRRPGYRRGTGCRTRPSPQLASLVASQVTAGRPRGGTPAHRSPRPSATPGTSGPCRSRARR